MLTWYTQPENNFASFYYYDLQNKILVRIRLALNRSSGSGETKAMYYNNVNVGFGSTKANNAAELDKRLGLSTSVDRGDDGRFEYDWTLGNENWKDEKSLHRGDRVSFSPHLPQTITETMLVTLAKKCAAQKQDIVLTQGTATEQALIAAIQKAISA